MEGCKLGLGRRAGSACDESILVRVGGERTRNMGAAPSQMAQAVMPLDQYLSSFGKNRRFAAAPFFTYRHTERGEQGRQTEGQAAK